MIQEFLRTVPLFQELDDEELTHILLAALVKRFAKGAPILQEEQPGGQLHVIREGHVRISKTVPGLGEEALTILGPGEFFGEVEFFDGAPASAHAIAHVRKLAPELGPDAIVLVSLSGRGDKDAPTVRELLGRGGAER